MPKRAPRPDDLYKLKFISDAAISPDRSAILFGVKTIVREKNSYLTHLYEAKKGGEPRQLTRGKASATCGRYSPDGSKIAFISKREEEGPQIHILPLDGGEAHAVTDLPEGAIADLQWSPDGRRIAFQYRQTAENRTHKAEKERKETGESDPPWVLDDLWYRLDGDGYFGAARFGIHVLDLETGEQKRIYERDKMGIYSFDWHPSGKRLLVAHSANREPLIQRPNDQLYILGLDGKAKKLPGLPKGGKDSPKFSPDGKRIAYYGSEDVRDVWGARNTRLYVVSARGGEPTCLTQDDDYCLHTGTASDSAEIGFGGAYAWASDGTGLIVSIGTKGEVQIGRVDANKGGVKLLSEGKHCAFMTGAGVGDRHVACWLTDPTSPAEVAVLDLKSKTKAPRVVTDFNKGFKREVAIARPRDGWVKAEDGHRTHFWRLMPAKPRKRNPAILEVHGGPHAQYGWCYFHEFQLLAAAGYVVVYSNPRGSKGYGEAHCHAISGKWGDRDWADVQAVTKWIKSRDYVDPRRVGIMGGSYGGYMTNWAISHSDGYKAAITDRCVVNWVSMAGNCDFPLTRDDYFHGYFYGDLGAISELWAQSPMSCFDQVRTPTLIIHSEGDLRCNVEQGEQVFTALKLQGVPCRFVRYPRSSSHGLSRSGPPDLRVHRLEQILSWWKEWL